MKKFDYPFYIQREDGKFLSFVGEWTDDIDDAAGYMMRWQAEYQAEKIVGAKIYIREGDICNRLS